MDSERRWLYVSIAAGAFLLAQLVAMALPPLTLGRWIALGVMLACIAVIGWHACRPRGGWLAYWRDCPLWGKGGRDGN